MQEPKQKMIKDIKKLIEYPKEGILSKKLAGENANVALFCMAKGTNISSHTSTKKGFVYVVEGNGVFNLEGKDIKMTQDIFIFMKENAVHSLNAKENTSFILCLFN